MKDWTKKILLFGIIAFILKSILVFFMNGPFIYPDEACVVQRAIFFINNFQIESCSKITGLNSLDPPPLFSVVISPIYKIFNGMSSYYTVLIFNSLLVCSLIFPLYKIFRHFKLNKNKSLLYSFILLFIPQIFLYEKMLLTETLFAVFFVWFISFYIESFTSNNKKKYTYKSISILLAILSIFIRPFGFILLLSLIINELILSKKIIKYLFILIISSTLIYFIVEYQNPQIFSHLYKVFVSIFEKENLILLLTAIKNQINSYTLSIFLLPILLFYKFLNYNYNNKNIKFLLISLVLLNFIISSQHIYNYYLNGNEIGYQTRYINISLITLIICSIIYLEKVKKLIYSKKDYFLITLLILFLILGEPVAKYTQNIELAPFYSKSIIDGKIITLFNSSSSFYLLIPFLLIVFSLFKKQKQVIIVIYLAILLFISGISFNFIRVITPVYKISDYFSNKNNQKITYLIEENENNIKEAWRILALTNNKIDFSQQRKEYIYLENIDTDYFITKFELDLPLILEDQYGYKIYNNK